MRAIGRLVDRFGAVRVGVGASGVVILATAAIFFAYTPLIPVIVLFVAFMLGTSGRNVAYNTLVSKVPFAHERARFMSVQSAVQHLAASVGAFLSAELLVSNADGSLGGTDRIAWVSIVLAVLAPFVMHQVQTRLAASEAAAA
jgi:MFS family permease